VGGAQDESADVNQHRTFFLLGPSSQMHLDDYICCYWSALADEARSSSDCFEKEIIPSFSKFVKISAGQSGLPFRGGRSQAVFLSAEQQGLILCKSKLLSRAFLETGMGKCEIDRIYPSG
jgi:hypothetical protein